MLEVPPAQAGAAFAPGFAPVALLTVDTEEEFDWNGPFSQTGHGLDHVPRLRKFQQFCENIGVSPVYLIDWPVAHSPFAIEIIGGAVRDGKAELGIQLHPWVNPPHSEEINGFNSFAGNLPAEVEREKFLRLRDAIAKNFAVQPLIYRAGRYGLGPNTADLLKDAGILIDSSVRAHFDYGEHGGPDYRNHPLHPYWIDRERTLLELPLTSPFAGRLRQHGRCIYPALKAMPSIRSAMARAGLLERISLTPEGVNATEALRGIGCALEAKLPVLVFSFHSPSLVPGFTPYVRNEEDLDDLYDWWRAVYAELRLRGVKPTTIGEILKNVQR
ncbi:polysaccharide deacetylase family protein [Pseudopontixanthobacter vadosimaris]|uniref:polysaccharide deacetylase family protein n=1 Tax=Pseudopontixanthobacter vadosimaris TaxID=2726450 RepID=UPI00197C6193|nr:polysaccharide deacetylase family protein [Pseudopontixanthobacter vadosimaris]